MHHINTISSTLLLTLTTSAIQAFQYYHIKLTEYQDASQVYVHSEP